MRKLEVEATSTNIIVCVAFVFLNRFLDQESINTPQRVVQHIHSHPVTLLNPWQLGESVAVLTSSLNMSGIQKGWKLTAVPRAERQSQVHQWRPLIGSLMSCKSLEGNKSTSGQNRKWKASTKRH